MPYTEFSIEQAAAYLHLKTADIKQLLKYNEIPHLNAGGRITFIRREIDAWASQRILSYSHDHLAAYHKHSSSVVQKHDLSSDHALMPELLKSSNIVMELESKTKSSLIRSLVDLAERTELVNYPDDLRDSMFERESMCSTALGGGVAIPHPTHHDPYNFEDSFVLYARTIRPIPFGSADGEPSHHFFLLCCQDERIHLHVLARLSMMCYRTDLIMQLETITAIDEAQEAIFEAERDVIRKHL